MRPYDMNVYLKEYKDLTIQLIVNLKLNYLYVIERNDY